MGKPGRPRKIASPKVMREKADAYFSDCEESDSKPITLTGVIRAIGLSSKATLEDYAKRDEFSEPVKEIKLRVEQAYEERLHGNSPTGAIFALKNMGWSDRSQHEITGANGGDLQVKVTHRVIE